jgi:hypothetical protein
LGQPALTFTLCNSALERGTSRISSLAKGFQAIAWVESKSVKKKGTPRMPLILSEL